VLRNSKKTDLADVIVYVHDSSDTNSFSYISNLRVGDFRCSSTPELTLVKQQYSLDHIPTLFVATKSDLDLAQQVRAIMIYASQSVWVTLSLPYPETRSAAGRVLQKTKFAGACCRQCKNWSNRGRVSCHLQCCDASVRERNCQLTPRSFS
jgi:hypothetical protein